MPFVPVKKVEKEEQQFVPTKRATAPRENVSQEQISSLLSDPNFMGSASEVNNPIAAKKIAEFAKNNPREAGAILGALRGSRGGAGGTVLGGVLGGILGEQVGQLGELAADDPNAPRTTKESLKRQAIAGGKSAAEEVVGFGALKVANKIIAPFAKAVTKEGRLAWETLEKYMPKRSAPVLPAEATSHWGLDLMHNIASKSFVSGQAMGKHRDIIRHGAVNDMLDDLVNNFGGMADPVALGNMVTEAAKNNWKAYRSAITDPIYNRIEEITKPIIKKVPRTKVVETGTFTFKGDPVTKTVPDGFDEIPISKVSVPTDVLKSAVEVPLRKLRGIKSIGKDNAGDNLVIGIADLAKEIDVGTAIELRKRLISISDELSITNKKDPAIGLAKHLTGKLDDIITASLKKQNPEAHDLWKAANKLYKEGSQKYNNRFIRQLVRQADPEKGLGQPEAVLKTIFQNGGVSGVNKVKAAVGQETWDQLKGWHVKELILKSTNKKGVVDGATLRNKMFGPTGMRQEAMEAIYTKGELELLKNNAITLGVIQASQGGGGGSMLIQLVQGSAIAGLATGNLPKTSAAILLGPEALARMMLNKTTAKWLINTQKLSQRGAIAGSSVARLAKAADFIEDQILREKSQEN